MVSFDSTAVTCLLYRSLLLSSGDNQDDIHQLISFNLKRNQM